MTSIDPGVGLRFAVNVDGVEIGSFTGCEGLAAEYEIYEHEEGGLNGYVHRIPGRLKYSPVKLTRPLDERSPNLAKWFAGFQTSVTRCTASIRALDSAGGELARWNLIGVYPAKWSGPSFSADGSSVAKETLELAHNGFFG
jgi:phage tail-like protein